ncbi:MAG TPA: hypothetical protein VFU30_14965 [Gaiellaceae bacterium]|nr:hypothetical protein [Gaiellaceae bacterium]
MEMPWTITITGLVADGMEVDVASGAIATLLDGRGHAGITVSALPLAAELALPLQQPRRRRRRTYIGGCPECGAQAGLHALSCRHYEIVPAEPEHLSEACLEELRSLPPSQWYGWPPDDYDQGLPVVEIRQDHLEALLAEVDSWRNPE